MPTPSQFKRLIKEYGYTYKKVGSEIGVHPSVLSSYLNGYSLDLPSKSKYYRLCELLNIDILF